MSIVFQNAIIVYTLLVWFHASRHNNFVLAMSLEMQKKTLDDARPKIASNQSDNELSETTKNFSATRMKRNEEMRRDRISDIKCKEYSEMTREVVWIRKIEPMPIRLRCKKLINLLVVGGSVAGAKEYPHTVALGWALDNSTTEYFCGGSLVSDRWILTAAHCTRGNRGPPDVALLGSGNLNKINELNTGKLMSIGRIERHPDYVSSRLYADIALVELSEPVEFSKTIKPACLYSISDSEPKRLWVSGYGSTSLNEGMTGLNLTKAQLQLVDAEYCERIYREVDLLPRGIDPESQLCAGDTRGGWKRDTCAGDSGVPLQSPHPLGCLQEIVAVTSFGMSCAVPEVPGVYTKVSYYVDWIESIVWPDEEKPYASISDVSIFQL